MKLRIRKGVSTSLPFQQGRDIDDFAGFTHQRSREGPYRKRDRPECVIKAILDPRSSSRPEIHDWRPQTDDATASHTVPECGLNSAASTAQGLVLHEMIQLEPPLQFLHQTTIHL
ncbi:hypothetical protein POM88_051909 [Heracleum sosnowskyi]|uniref:Uncharacterized protein n=1 Tax=Heracleum sosnowskyi TaxID=360622 RepID=A0AAD8GS74_9APIA|nr:hypothetical protein POM88_051909 [Heracleum sosnowskyi]